MTDWTRATGTAGTMMVRDTGTYVEFWLKGPAGTWNYDLPWGYTVNGVTDNTNEFRFEASGAYQMLGRWAVSTDQTVTFYLGNTGLSELGGPTTFNVTINRGPTATAPAAPGQPKFTNITNNSVIISFTDGANNGASIDTRRIGWGTSPSQVQNYTTSDGSTQFVGLTPGVSYYVWAQTHNAYGWSPFSARNGVTMHNVPPAPTAVALSEVKQTSAVAKFWSNGDGLSPILEWQLGYGTNPTTPQLFMSSSGTSTVTGLAPGAKYYFWARGRNKYGWGPWSAVTNTNLRAGARVFVNGVAKVAVPYVRINGVWRPAVPFVKSYGDWRETT